MQPSAVYKALVSMQAPPEYTAMIQRKKDAKTRLWDLQLGIPSAEEINAEIPNVASFIAERWGPLPWWFCIHACELILGIHFKYEEIWTQRPEVTMFGFGDELDEETEFKHRKRWKAAEWAAHEIIVRRRHLEQTNIFREELCEAVRRRQTIQMCRTIKEELLQAVYHPRRIERLLELGGWEALDNFAGL